MKRQKAKLSEKEKYKNSRLHVRLTAQEAQSLKEIAKREGISVSDLVRNCLLSGRVGE